MKSGLRSSAASTMSPSSRHLGCPLLDLAVLLDQPGLVTGGDAAVDPRRPLHHLAGVDDLFLGQHLLDAQQHGDALLQRLEVQLDVPMQLARRTFCTLSRLSRAPTKQMAFIIRART